MGCSANTPEWVSGNVFIRPVSLARAGDVTAGHAHHFDHTTIVLSGGIRVRADLPDGRTIDREFHAPAHCLILAGVEHEITALADDTAYWCVYSHRTPQGEVSQVYTGWEEAYV
jgi:quercetin dioxygenase-like cupin family protein